MKVVLLTLAFCVSSFFLKANAIFEEANAAYKEGNYSVAIEKYNALLADGENGQLHYNLGNSYYKTGNISKSILHYEKALIFNPNDAEIEHNLNIVNLNILDKINATPEFFLLTWWKQMAKKQKANQWTILFFVFLWMGILLFVAFTFINGSTKRLPFFGGIFSLLIALIMVLFALTQNHYETQKNSAIIISASVSVKSAPLTSGTDLFIIHEGLKVKVLDQENEWSNIRLADGKEGWINNSMLESI